MGNLAKLLKTVRWKAVCWVSHAAKMFHLHITHLSSEVHQAHWAWITTGVGPVLDLFLAHFGTGRTNLGHFEQSNGHQWEPMGILEPQTCGCDGPMWRYLPPTFGGCPDLCTQGVELGSTLVPLVACCVLLACCCWLDSTSHSSGYLNQSAKAAW